MVKARLRIKTLMILIIPPAFGLAIAGNLRHRAGTFARIAEFHQTQSITAYQRGRQQLGDVHADKARKYREAANRPWRAVEPEQLDLSDQDWSDVVGAVR